MPSFNDLEVIEVILSGGGIGAVFAWVLFKAYMQSVSKSLDIQERRIDAVEQRSRACEDDRALLHKQLENLQGETLANTKIALDRSSEALERVAKLAEQRGWSIVPKESK